MREVVFQLLIITIAILFLYFFNKKLNSRRINDKIRIEELKQSIKEDMKKFHEKFDQIEKNRRK